MNIEFSKRLKKIEDSLSFSLQRNFSEDWRSLSFGNLSSSITGEHILNLIEPNAALIELGGKRWRPLLMILCYELTSSCKNAIINSEEIYSLTPLVEFVHTASLIHDDIEDSSDLRRGKPSAHITYGLDAALNSASWLYFEAPVCLKNAKIPDSIKILFYEIYLNEIRRLHLGQAMDIFWHKNPDIFPSAEEYKAMVKCKTGTLASLASRIGCVAGGASILESDSFSEIASEIGIGFQIIDDVINLTDGNAGKKRGDDIVENKKSLPVLLHVQKNPEHKNKISTLMNEAYKNGINSPAVEECISLLNSDDCIKKAADEGINLIRKNSCKFKEIFTNGNDEISSLIIELFENMIPEAFK